MQVHVATVICGYGCAEGLPKLAGCCWVVACSRFGGRTHVWTHGVYRLHHNYGFYSFEPLQARAQHAAEVHRRQAKRVARECIPSRYFSLQAGRTEGNI